MILACEACCVRTERRDLRPPRPAHHEPCALSVACPRAGPAGRAPGVQAHAAVLGRSTPPGTHEPKVGSGTSYVTPGRNSMTAFWRGALVQAHVVHALILRET